MGMIALMFNSINTTFYNENVSLTNWKTLYIPYENTKEQYFNGKQYFHHDAAFAKRPSEDTFPLLPAQSGWYYFTVRKTSGLYNGYRYRSNKVQLSDRGQLAVDKKQFLF